MDERQESTPRLAELLERAWTRHGLKGVATTVVQFPAEANRWTAVAHATVETDRGAFSGLGEASPESATPGLAARLVEAAEARAVARALGWATNTIPAVTAGPTLSEGAGAAALAPPASEPVDGEPAAVPAWLRADESATATPSAAGPTVPVTTGEARGDAPQAAPDLPEDRRAADRRGRAFATAQSLWKACAARGIAAPEPDPGWAEARLQEYVATWSAELREAAAPARSRRSQG